MSEISLTMLIKKESNIIGKAHWLKHSNILAKTKFSEVIIKNRHNGWKSNNQNYVIHLANIYTR